MHACKHRKPLAVFVYWNGNGIAPFPGKISMNNNRPPRILPTRVGYASPRESHRGLPDRVFPRIFNDFSRGLLLLPSPIFSPSYRIHRKYTVKPPRIDSLRRSTQIHEIPLNLSKFYSRGESLSYSNHNERVETNERLIDRKARTDKRWRTTNQELRARSMRNPIVIRSMVMSAR